MGQQLKEAAVDMQDKQEAWSEEVEGEYCDENDWDRVRMEEAWNKLSKTDILRDPHFQRIRGLSFGSQMQEWL